MCSAERSGWDVFVWYGAIYQMARALGEAGVDPRSRRPWAADLRRELVGGAVVLLSIYLYAHYAFATITAHVSAILRRRSSSS